MTFQISGSSRAFQKDCNSSYYTECPRKKLTLLNCLPNEKCETFSENFYTYGWLKVSSII